MNTQFKNLKFIYIFYLTAVLILASTLTIYLFFANTKNYVEDTTKHIYINYTHDIAQNISTMIKQETSNNIYNDLKNSKKIKKKLEENLQLFISDRYRYIYVVDKVKESNNYRFLLDGSKNIEDKSEFEELYEPLNINKFHEVYRSKKESYFIQKDAQGVWMTFVKPIVKDGKTQALLVIDFSMQGHQLIDNSLQGLDNILKVSVYLGVFLFLIIILFAYIDNKRAKELKSFNEKLELKVQEELENNRKKNQQLIEQSRLAQMGEMISMIAHQWRQPLSAISSASASIKVKSALGKLDAEIASSLADAISNYSQHLSTTIDDFRDFFKSNKEKSDITYNKLLESVLGIIEISIQNKNITIIKNLNSKESFYSYQNELKQVLLNLIKNAEDILLEKGVKNPTITIQTNKNILTISDNGGGIGEDIIEKIFDPYFSTKEGRNGTGLGLYMSKTIIEEHCDGKLSVQNNEEGAVFTIELNS